MIDDDIPLSRSVRADNGGGNPQIPAQLEPERTSAGDVHIWVLDRGRQRVPVGRVPDLHGRYRALEWTVRIHLLRLIHQIGSYYTLMKNFISIMFLEVHLIPIKLFIGVILHFEIF